MGAKLLSAESRHQMDQGTCHHRHGQDDRQIHDPGK